MFQIFFIIITRDNFVVENFVYPIFITDELEGTHPIETLPGQSRHGLMSVVEFLRPLVERQNLKGIIKAFIMYYFIKTDIHFHLTEVSIQVLL